MSELTAQMVQRGRGPTAEEAARRRQLARDVRSARERLTSSIGLERAFDYELLRLYAEYRIGAFLPLMLLALCVAAASAFWSPVALSAAWFGGVLASAGGVAALARSLLRADPDHLSLRSARRRAMVGEFLQSTAWALLVVIVFAIDSTNLRTFVMFALVIVAAVTTTLAATVPFAAYAGLLPLSAAALSLLAMTRDVESVLLITMAVGAQLFFLLLSNHLHASTVAALRSRAEKDAIFGELEQAKANSDEARRRAEEANLAKSRFLATMSHELRTPLNAILGFSEVMKNQVFGPHAAPSYQEYSTDIHDSGLHLLNLINEILDLSRIEAGRYELNEEAMQLAYVVEECRHMMSLRARAKNQTFRELVDPSLPRLWADERAVRQIVLNILSNAIKFTPPGGEIVVKVGWTSSGGQYVSVRDTGPGIPEDEIPTVMSSFGRGSLAIKTAEQGSGLGLPIVKGLVDLHNGSFQLKSKPREGTEVIVTFPAARVMDALPAIEVDEDPARAGRAVRAA
ncbi:HAMP domain-containing sensor histidine kinase [uncultured Methylobacterium sp.]|jgi:two-component system cell cycle sensor histidine kinase PleC|uniref:sensor histidine kinase n=1 Tax=uncultured Methylobacterium sp. TaxID=157278 RepID=UPI00260D6586|nr:HAMP domain-containing sensor histidine kinase [uncultured Methylobacterium sp.]